MDPARKRVRLSHPSWATGSQIEFPRGLTDDFVRSLIEDDAVPGM